MPILTIHCNQPAEDGAAQDVIAEASQIVARQLGKSEQYVMVMMAPPTPMILAGRDRPMAYLELKSIGLPEDRAGPLSEALCELLHRWLGVPPERTYIVFTDVPRSLWGWNGTTF